LRGLPREVPHLIKKIMPAIPKKHLDELEGIVEGYNKKREKWNFLKGESLELNELIFFICSPILAA